MIGRSGARAKALYRRAALLFRARRPADEHGYVIEWPLWGLRLESDEGDAVENVVVGICILHQDTWAEWEETENSQVVYEHAGRELMAERLDARHPTAPVCLRLLIPMDDEGDEGAVEAAFAEYFGRARDIVAALRLYVAGDFIDPVETGTYVTHPSGLVSREVNVFRSAFYGWVPETPYVLPAGDARAIADLARNVRTVANDRVHGNASIALESFCLSFSSTVSDRERALHRFIALEALLGPLRKKRAGATFEVRAGHAAGDVPEASTWLAQAGRLRNSLAHNFHDTPVSRPDLIMLETLSRGALRAYLAHVCAHTDGGDSLAHPILSFNRALASGPIPSDAPQDSR